MERGCHHGEGWDSEEWDREFSTFHGNSSLLPPPSGDGGLERSASECEESPLLLYLRGEKLVEGL